MLTSPMLSKQIMAAEAVPAARLGRVHFAGIGGAGMSGIARIMLARGIPVSGSDSMPSAMLDELAALGASVHVGHASGNLGGLGAGDTLVVSSAIRPDNPELAEASRRGMRVLHRAAALASVMAGRRVIAIAGTHGKTTTTSMLTTVLRECGADPGYVIGGILTETGLGAEDGTGLDFVAEADHFLLNCAVIGGLLMIVALGSGRISVISTMGCARRLMTGPGSRTIRTKLCRTSTASCICGHLLIQSIRVDFVLPAAGDDAPVAGERDGRAELGDFGQVMRGVDDSGALGGALAHHGEQRAPRHRVGARGQHGHR